MWSTAGAPFSFSSPTGARRLAFKIQAKSHRREVHPTGLHQLAVRHCLQVLSYLHHPMVESELAAEAAVCFPALASSQGYRRRS